MLIIEKTTIPRVLAELTLEADEEESEFLRKIVSEMAFSTREMIGYSAGQFIPEQRLRIEDILDIEHPVFGKISEVGPPTTAEAFMLGTAWAKGICKTLKELRVIGIENLKKLIDEDSKRTSSRDRQVQTKIHEIY